MSILICPRCHRTNLGVAAVPPAVPSSAPKHAIAAVCAAVAMLAGVVASAAQPDQMARWNAAKIRPEWIVAADKLVAAWQRDHAVYERLAAARANGVPAPFIFGFHERESSRSFNHHLHEGSTLAHRTRYVPKNRPVVWQPPSDWYSSALDALYDYEHLERRDWNNGQSALQAAESYNGLGYQNKNRVSPYLWSGTNLFDRGKYTGDGKFDVMARDQQIGVATILIRMRERGLPIPSALVGNKNGIVLPKQTAVVVAAPAPAAMPKMPGVVPELERPAKQMVQPTSNGGAFSAFWKWLTQ